MDFYIFLFIFVIVLSLFFPKNKYIGLLVVFILCFFSMFRGENVGTDTSVYMDVFYMQRTYEHSIYSSFNSRNNIEYITYILYTIIVEYHLSPRLIIIFFSLLTFFFLFLAIKRMKISYCIGLLIFFILFYFSSFNIARQICSAVIVLYAITFLFDGTYKKIYFFAFILLASLIHASSLLYLPLYLIVFLKNKKICKKNILINIAILLFIINQIGAINLIEFISQKFENVSYITTYSSLTETFSRTLFGRIQDLAKFLALIMIFSYKKTDTTINLFDLLFYIIIIISIFSGNLHSDIARIFIPIQLFVIIYIPYIYGKNNGFTKSIAFIVFLVVNSFFTLWGISSGSGEIIPYILDMSF